MLFNSAKGIRRFWLFPNWKIEKLNRFVLGFLKLSKNKQKKMYLHVQVNNNFAQWQFGGQFLFLFFIFYFLPIVLWSQRKVFANFQKMYLFKVPCNFFENENFAMRAKFANLLELYKYSVLDLQQCVQFWKSHIVLNHSTLVWRHLYARDIVPSSSPINMSGNERILDRKSAAAAVDLQKLVRSSYISTHNLRRYQVCTLLT